MENVEFQNRLLRYAVIALMFLLLIIIIAAGVYIADTRNLRREMMGWVHESIKLEYEQLRELKDKNIEKGYEELEQLEKLIDDYNNDSMEMNELLEGMENEIARMRQRS